MGTLPYTVFNDTCCWDGAKLSGYEKPLTHAPHTTHLLVWSSPVRQKEDTDLSGHEAQGLLWILLNDLEESGELQPGLAGV